MRPEAIYLVSDGNGPAGQDLVGEVARFNVEKRIKIHVIAMSPDEEGADRLKRLAAANGGTFYQMDAQELNP
jgi:hypothetical protein